MGRLEILTGRPDLRVNMPSDVGFAPPITCKPPRSVRRRQSKAEEEQSRYAGRRSFFNALERLPRYTVRRGRRAYIGRSRRGGPIFEQKPVDILLGVALVLLAAKRLIP